MADYTESRNEEMLRAIIDETEYQTEYTQGRNELILQSIIDGTEYTEEPQSRIEELLLELKEKIETGGGSETLDALIERTIESVKSDATQVGSYAFRGALDLEIADFSSITKIGLNCFYDTNLSILIIRSNNVCVLESTTSFNRCPFANGNSGGTLYVPESLIADYQNANNWNTLLGYPNNKIEKIEGSIYE